MTVKGQGGDSAFLWVSKALLKQLWQGMVTGDEGFATAKTCLFSELMHLSTIQTQPQTRRQPDKTERDTHLAPQSRQKRASSKLSYFPFLFQS